MQLKAKHEPSLAGRASRFWGGPAIGVLGALASGTLLALVWWLPGQQVPPHAPPLQVYDPLQQRVYLAAEHGQIKVLALRGGILPLATLHQGGRARVWALQLQNDGTSLWVHGDDGLARYDTRDWRLIGYWRGAALQQTDGARWSGRSAWVPPG